MGTTKSDLEKYIEEIATKNEVPLKKTFETTPGVGNCWYEACATLLKINNIKTISAKQLRKEIVDNIEHCDNFPHVFDMIFKSDHKKLEEFKKQHHREGEFTDGPGVMVVATAFYLGVSIRVFSKSNTKKLPYTEYNPNRPVIFNIFFDDRSSGHFQSLIQPESTNKQKNPGNTSQTKNIGQQWTQKEAEENYINRFHNEQEIYEPKQTIRVGKMENIPTTKDKAKQPNTENKANSTDGRKTITKIIQKEWDKEEPVELKTTETKTLQEKLKTYAEVAKNAKQGNKQQKHQKFVLAFEMADELQRQQEEEIPQGEEITQEKRQSLLNDWYSTCEANGVIPRGRFKEDKVMEASKNQYEAKIEEAKKQLDMLSKQNNKLLADISEKKKRLWQTRTMQKSQI